MKPFDVLTWRGQVRRMRRLAQTAVAAYPLASPRIKFLRQAGNTLFRIGEASPTQAARPRLYAPGQYLLRIHDPGYQTPAAVELELLWLLALSREAGLPVPEPVFTRAGPPCLQVAVPGVPGERTCSLLRWLSGRELTAEEIQPQHYRALGELAARMHQYTSGWQPPAGLSKRTYDWDGLFGKEGADGLPSGEGWSLLPLEMVEPFTIVSRRVKQVMDRWGRGQEVYGLIHGDLGMGVNVLFWKGDARIIDFDDSGFGYYLYDLAVVLEDSQDHQIQPRFRAALLDGYARIRPLVDEQVQALDLFLAGFAVFWCLYAVDVVRYHPEDRAEIYERITRYFRLVEHYLASQS